MLSKKGGIVIFMAALLAVTAVMPMASASNITTVVSPSTDSANVTAYINSTVTIQSNNTLEIALASLFANFSSQNVQKTFNTSSPIFTGLENSIQNNTSSARLNYLMFDVSSSYAKVSSYKFIMNYSLKMVMNVTNIYHNGQLDLAWRAFSDNQSVVIDRVSYNHFNTSQGTAVNYNSLNFTAFSKPLSNWTRAYDATTNTTTFTNDAGYTLNYTSNTTGFFGYYTNISVKSDPSYTIVTPGYAVAGTNSLTYENPPSTGVLPYLYYAIVVVIIAVGLGVAVSSRRKHRY